MQQVTIENVLSIVNENIEGVSFSVENLYDNLADLGMDSIMFIQMVVALEENLECEIPDSKLIFSEMNTISKLMDVLQNLYEESEKMYG